MYQYARHRTARDRHIDFDSEIVDDAFAFDFSHRAPRVTNKTTSCFGAPARPVSVRLRRKQNAISLTFGTSGMFILDKPRAVDTQ
jgi:hypothetical protein